MIAHRTVGVDQKAIGWIDPRALLISLLCGPGRIGSFLLVTNEPTEETKEKTDKLEALARPVEKPGGSI